MSIAPTPGHIAGKMPVPNRFWAMFGCGWCYLRVSPTPEYKAHELRTTYVLNVRFVDRLRILITGRLHVAATTRVQALTNRTVTTSAFTVLSPTATPDPPQSWVSAWDAETNKKFRMEEIVSPTAESLPDEDVIY